MIDSSAGVKRDHCVKRILTFLVHARHHESKEQLNCNETEIGNKSNPCRSSVLNGNR